VLEAVEAESKMLKKNFPKASLPHEFNLLSLAGF
jgi:hypothetical protein